MILEEIVLVNDYWHFKIAARKGALYIQCSNLKQ